MRVSLSWLKELVDVDDSPHDLAERLSMAGFEVEDIEDLASRAEGVLVGFVRDVLPHPNADKLRVCEVDIGDSNALQIVCGAPNVRAGIHVPVAVIGTILPSVGLKIKASKLRGVSSQGMICSLAELGIAGASEGIAILDEITESHLDIGRPVGPLLGLDDIIFELAITANRPDGMSMAGIAREVAALTGGSLNLPRIELKNDYEILNPDKVSKCEMSRGGLYGTTKVENLDGNMISPSWLIKRLQNAGINSVNTIVDITNLIMLEQGQPLHAFDGESLKLITGKSVTAQSFGLRYASRGEIFTCLDKSTIQLDDSCLVVTCHNHVIAIAGVMGSYESAVNNNTTDIWLESALFSASSVRKSARSAGMRTEASSRFEKGIPVEMTMFSAQRACNLMEKYCGAKITGTWVFGEPNPKPRKVLLRKDAIHKLLGPLNRQTNISNLALSNLYGDKLNEVTSLSGNYLGDDVIEDALTALGCILNSNELGWDVTVPPNRKKDLHREVDLIEEIARLVGFDSFEANLPDPIEPGGLNDKQICEREIRIGLCASGLQEVTTLSLVGAEESDEQRIPISNPLLMETSHLRTNLWQEHLKICDRNLKASLEGCWIFEIGSVFHNKNNQFNQKTILGGIICGERRTEKWTNSAKPLNLNYFQARGRLESTFRALNLEVKDKPLTDDPLLHPGRAAEIVLEGKCIGRFGQLHPAIAREVDLIESTYLFEIELDPIVSSATRKSKWITSFTQFATVPAMERDISLVVNRDCPSIELINEIYKAGRPLIEHVELIDRYEGSNLPTNKCSQAFRLRFRDKHETLTDQLVQPIHDRITKLLNDKFAAELRS